MKSHFYTLLIHFQQDLMMNEREQTTKSSGETTQNKNCKLNLSFRDFNHTCVVLENLFGIIYDETSYFANGLAKN